MPCERNHDRGGERGQRQLGKTATAQDGVVSLHQLRDLGLTNRSAADRADQGQLYRVHRGVYAVGHRPTGRAGVLRAALLACGEGAVVSHGTAATLWGIRDGWPHQVDVIVPGQAGRKLDGVRCRRCRYPRREEIDRSDGIARTTPARTLVDLAGGLGEHSLRRCVERAAVLKLLDLGALDLALREATGRTGVPTLRRILEAWHADDGPAPDLRSEFEALMLSRLVETGLPRPGCNVPLQIGEEQLIVDFLWERQRLVVETDGARTHDTPIAFQRDRRRDQILVAAGYRVTRVTWRQVRDEGEAVVGRIARALRAASD